MRISKLDYETALKNGIPKNTVYNRIKRGWEVADAITIPAGQKLNSKRQSSPLWGIELGKARTFKLPLEHEEKWEKIVQGSGLTEQDLASAIIWDWLKSKEI